MTGVGGKQTLLDSKIPAATRSNCSNRFRLRRRCGLRENSQPGLHPVGRFPQAASMSEVVSKTSSPDSDPVHLCCHAIPTACVSTASRKTSSVASRIRNGHRHIGTDPTSTETVSASRSSCGSGKAVADLRARESYLLRYDTTGTAFGTADVGRFCAIVGRCAKAPLAPFSHTDDGCVHRHPGYGSFRCSRGRD